MITEITFGIICLNTITERFTPIAFAAVTNSCSRSASTCARTSLARLGQLNIPRITMIRAILALSVILFPIIDVKIIAIGRNGRHATISVIRCNTISTQPPKKPDTPPTMIPMIVEMITEIAPIVMVIRPPFKIRVNTSRPSSSLPNR